MSDTNENGEHDGIDRLIAQAQTGCPDALGELVEACRPYLLLIANQEVGHQIKAKIGASDVVQETLLQARNDIATFQGSSKKQLLGWLRQILLHEVADTHRHYQNVQKRAVGREQPLPSDSVVTRHAQGKHQPTPSSHATALEEARALREAMLKLPQDYIDVLNYRNWQQMPWNEIGDKMDRSPDSARQLWRRAVGRLKVELEHK